MFGDYIFFSFVISLLAFLPLVFIFPAILSLINVCINFTDNLSDAYYIQGFVEELTLSTPLGIKRIFREAEMRRRNF